MSTSVCQSMSNTAFLVYGIKHIPSKATVAMTMSVDRKYSLEWVRSERHRRANLFDFTKNSESSNIASHVRSIARHLVCVQSQELDATLVALWTRLPYPRPDKAHLLKLFSEPCALVTRYWGPRVTLQLSVPDVRAVVSAACANAVRRSRTLSLVRGLSPGHAGAVRDASERLEGEVTRLFESQPCVASDHVAELVSKSMGHQLDELPAALRKLLHQGLRYTTAVLLTVDGIAKRGIETNRNVTLFRDATPHPQLDAVQATVALARAYFKAYAPASEADFRRWVGVPALQSRQSVSTLISDGELVEVDTDLGTLLVPAPTAKMGGKSFEKHRWDVDTSKEGDEFPKVVFRGKFDPLLLAHADKTWIIDDQWRSHVWSSNADIAATVLVDGRIVGTWKHVKGCVAVTLFETISKRDIIAEIKRGALEIGSDYYGHECVEVCLSQSPGRGRNKRKRDKGR